MKKFLLLFFAVFTMISTVVYAGNLVKKVYFSPYPISIDGEEYYSEMPILQYQERTYVALREFSEMVGVEVDFVNDQIIIKTNVEENETENLGSNEKEIEQEKQENLLIKTNLVYVSKTGKKYHKLSNCNSATYFEISLSEAIAEGYTPCLRCAK